jgi:hypothetical protein
LNLRLQTNQALYQTKKAAAALKISSSLTTVPRNTVIIERLEEIVSSLLPSPWYALLILIAACDEDSYCL